MKYIVFLILFTVERLFSFTWLHFNTQSTKFVFLPEDMGCSGGNSVTLTMCSVSAVCCWAEEASLYGW